MQNTINSLSLKDFFSVLKNSSLKEVLVLAGGIFGCLLSSYELGGYIQETRFEGVKFKIERSNSLLQLENQSLKEQLQRWDSKNKISPHGNSTVAYDLSVTIVMFNEYEKAIAVELENISSNNERISSHTITIHPHQFGKLHLKRANYRWTAKRFVDIAKSTETESNVFHEGIIRIHEEKIVFLKLESLSNNKAIK